MVFDHTYKICQINTTKTGLNKDFVLSDLRPRWSKTILSRFLNFGPFPNCVKLEYTFPSNPGPVLFIRKVLRTLSGCFMLSRKG